MAAYSSKILLAVFICAAADELSNASQRVGSSTFTNSTNTGESFESGTIPDPPKSTDANCKEDAAKCWYEWCNTVGHNLYKKLGGKVKGGFEFLPFLPGSHPFSEKDYGPNPSPRQAFGRFSYGELSWELCGKWYYDALVQDRVAEPFCHVKAASVQIPDSDEQGQPDKYRLLFLNKYSSDFDAFPDFGIQDGHCN